MFKVGQVVYKSAGVNVHPSGVKAGTKGVITRTPNRNSPYYLIEYARKGGDWHVREGEFYTLGNRYSDAIEEAMCCPDGILIGTFGGVLTKVNAVMGRPGLFGWRRCDVLNNNEKIEVITLLSIVDDETIDAIIEALK